MQHVELVIRQHLDGALQFGCREEGPAAIHHEPAPREARLVVDGDERNRGMRVTIDEGSGNAYDEARPRDGLNLDSLGGDAK